MGGEGNSTAGTYTFVDALELVIDVYNEAQDPSRHTCLPFSSLQVQFGQSWGRHYSLSSFSQVDSGPGKGLLWINLML